VQKKLLVNVVKWGSYVVLLVAVRFFEKQCSATSNKIKLVHWPLTAGLLHLIQRGEDWTRPQPAQAPPRYTKCNSPPVNGQCTNHCIAVRCSARGFNVGTKGLTET